MRQRYWKHHGHDDRRNQIHRDNGETYPYRGAGYAIPTLEEVFSDPEGIMTDNPEFLESLLEL